MDVASTSAFISGGWGRTGGARALLDGGPEAVPGSNWREGTVVIFSVWTSKDGTFVTVPDCTVSPGDADKLSLVVCTCGGSTGTGGAMEWGTAPKEFVLVKKKSQPQVINSLNIFIAVKLLSLYVTLTVHHEAATWRACHERNLLLNPKSDVCQTRQREVCGYDRSGVCTARLLMWQRW